MPFRNLSVNSGWQKARSGVYIPKQSASGVAETAYVTNFPLNEESGAVCADAMGNATAGDIYGSVTLGATGPEASGKAFTFDGNANNFVDLSSAYFQTNWTTWNQAISVMVWAKGGMGATAYPWGATYEYTGSNDTQTYFAYQDTGTARVLYGVDNQFGLITGDISDVWTFHAYVRRADNSVDYYQGASPAGDTDAGAQGRTITTFYQNLLGGRGFYNQSITTLNDTLFTGSVAHWAIWLGTALSDSDIDSLFL
jgi:hypothetical protein